MEGRRRSPSPIPDVGSPSNDPSQEDVHLFEGLAAEVKLLLKLIREHNSSARENDVRRPQRMAMMLSLLDDLRSRIHKSQASVSSKPKPELRRCNTELHRSPNNKDKKMIPPGPAGSMENSDQRRLERMFNSLSKERELIAAELSKRVYELESMEEMVADLRAQNEKLLEKVKFCGAEHADYKDNSHGASSTTGGGSNADGGTAVQLQERNREMTEQLIRSLEGHRTMKRKLKEVVEERERVNGKMAEMMMEAAAAAERVRRLKVRVEDRGIMWDELGVLERVFVGFYRKLMIAMAVPRGSPRDSSLSLRGSPRDSARRETSGMG